MSTDDRDGSVVPFPRVTLPASFDAGEGPMAYDPDEEAEAPDGPPVGSWPTLPDIFSMGPPLHLTVPGVHEDQDQEEGFTPPPPQDPDNPRLRDGAMLGLAVVAAVGVAAAHGVWHMAQGARARAEHRQAVADQARLTTDKQAAKQQGRIQPSPAFGQAARQQGAGGRGGGAGGAAGGSGRSGSGGGVPATFRSGSPQRGAERASGGRSGGGGSGGAGAGGRSGSGPHNRRPEGREDRGGHRRHRREEAEEREGRRERRERRRERRHERRERNAARQNAGLADRSADRDQRRRQRQTEWGDRHGEQVERRERRRTRKRERADRKDAERDARRTRRTAEDRVTLGEAMGREAERRWERRRAERDARRDAPKKPADLTPGTDGTPTPDPTTPPADSTGPAGPAPTFAAPPGFEGMTPPPGAAEPTDRVWLDRMDTEPTPPRPVPVGELTVGSPDAADAASSTPQPTPAAAVPPQRGARFVSAPVKSTQYKDADLTVYDVTDADSDMAEQITEGVDEARAAVDGCTRLMTKLEALHAKVVELKVPGSLAGSVLWLMEQTDVVRARAQSIAEQLPRASEAIATAGSNTEARHRHLADVTRDMGHVRPAERDYHND